jgi:hypothetical protein
MKAIRTSLCSARIRQAAGGSLLSVALLVAACRGEDRPTVDVIGGNGSASVSVSASGPISAGVAPTRYAPVSNVDSSFNIGLDLRDIRAVMAPAAEGRPVDWAAATAIYETGRNQRRPDGTLRSMASLAGDAEQAAFPNSAGVHGRPNFIDALIRDGLNGTGRAQGLSDEARRQVVDKGLQMLIYAKAVQELSAAGALLQQGNTDNANGAPHAVDEAWAAVAGAPDQNGLRSYALLETALDREANFRLNGKLRDPLESAFAAVQAAAQVGDVAAFNRLRDEVRGYLNAIFYLGTLRSTKLAEGDTTEAQRQAHLAEGGTFFQAIRAAVAAASPSAAETVEAVYARSPSQAFPSSETTRVYAALNEPAVLQALRIPSLLVVRAPPGP